MSAQEIIEEFKALPPAERAHVAKFVMEQDDSWVPESFKEGMKAAAEGRFVDMETALFETPPPHLRSQDWAARTGGVERSELAPESRYAKRAENQFNF